MKDKKTSKGFTPNYFKPKNIAGKKQTVRITQMRRGKK